MYPNPQDVLPLPAQPDLDWYRRAAKDLVKVCRRGERAGFTTWASGLAGDAGVMQGLAEFAQARLARTHDGRTCALSDAQFVVARAFGFASWPAFAAHLEALRDESETSAFERAAEAIVDGDEAALRRLLSVHPELVHARSAREHRATLLHYVAANGVENYRQRTPKNAVQVARLLLQAGAEVDAEAEMYGGGATTLGLTATSVHPAEAGVQLALIDILLEHGARLDRDGAGNAHSLVVGCLANGQPEAARYLANRGARLDLVGAAGIGRADVVRALLSEATPPDSEALTTAFAYACGYGHAEAVEVLLDRGVDPDRVLRLYGAGHTGLHIASYHAHIDVVRLLLRRGASLDLHDATWNTTPITWALQGWGDAKGSAATFAEVLTLLVNAGALVDDRHLHGAEAVQDPQIVNALRGRG